MLGHTKTRSGKGQPHRRDQDAKENRPNPASACREENKRLKHAVADLTLDNQILQRGALRKLVSPERGRKCVARYAEVVKPPAPAVRAVRIFKVSERRACRVLGQSRRTQRYIPKPDPEEDNLTAEIRMLSLGREAPPAYGYKRISRPA